MRYAGVVGAGLLLLVAAGAQAAPAGALERSVRAASLVVVAEDGRLTRNSPRPVLWSFRVADTLKGRSRPGELIVDLEKAPLGLWPRGGEKAILCLSPSRGNAYELASHCRSILPVSEAGTVRDVAGPPATTPVAVAPGPEKTRLVPDVVRRDSTAERMKVRVAESDTILVGRLSGVLPAGSGSTGVFKVEESLQGYGGFTKPITVHLQDRSPEAGKYVLFLRGSQTDDSFAATSAEGAVRLADANEEKRLKGSISAAVGGRGKVFTTIQATIIEWQEAWNARSLERCIRCYSSGSRLRREYESGDAGRKKLEEQMRSFPGKVALTLQSIATTRRTGAKAADVTVLLKLVANGLEDRRTATMQLVFEKGEWLIQNEGF